MTEQRNEAEPTPASEMDHPSNSPERSDLMDKEAVSPSDALVRHLMESEYARGYATCLKDSSPPAASPTEHIQNFIEKTREHVLGAASVDSREPAIVDCGIVDCGECRTQGCVVGHCRNAPTPNPVDSRAEFEAWWAREGHAACTMHGDALRGWQAARASAPQPVAGAGWKLVPIDPTEAMLAAAHDGDRAYTLRNFGDVMTVQQGPHDHWVAMLAAAPEPATRPVQAADLPMLPTGLCRDETRHEVPYYTADDMRAYAREAISALATPQQQAPAAPDPDAAWDFHYRKVTHGVNCPKIFHTGAGHLHAEDDDTPYDVDGCKYCGRCHKVLP